MKKINMRIYHKEKRIHTEMPIGMMKVIGLWINEDGDTIEAFDEDNGHGSIVSNVQELTEWSEIMFETVAKDKDKETLFEGDIVRQDFTIMNYCDSGLEVEGHYIGVVRMTRNGVVIKNPIRYIDSDHEKEGYWPFEPEKVKREVIVASHRCKKIGNEYENKELLEVKR